MAGLVERLSAHYPLVLLSNVDCYYWKVVEAAHPELRHFDALLLSCELGLAKPDPEIFAHAARTAGAEPSRCLFVDDSPVNIDAARALDFQTHCFRDAPGLLQRLREVGARGIEGST
jgi:HAD superfamily hydrolase (TIGR01549 family)